MTARESAVLMGFPTSWRLPTGSRAGQTAAGNAMCVPLARCIIEAAIATSVAPPPVSPSMTADTFPEEVREGDVPQVPVTTIGNDNMCQGCRKIKKRVRALEEQVRQLFQRIAPASDSE